MNAAARTRCATLGFVLLASAGSAAAQDVPVVFVHGLASSAEAWQDTAARLQERLRITAYGASLDWRDWFENQASRLQSGGGGALPSTTIAVGHSNGGLVSRQWSRSRGLAGIVTLGTPHEGALLVTRALDVLHFNYRLFDAANSLGVYLNGPGQNEFSWMWPFLAAHVTWTLGLSAQTAAGLASTLGILDFAPVLGQMAPGSAFLSELNAPANLARESAAVTRRVGLVFVAREYWKAGVAVALRPEWQDQVYVSKQVAIVAFDAAAAYLQVNYPPWHAPAQSLIRIFQSAARLLRELDPLWCWAVTNDFSCATSHDGVVSTPAQFYPGAVNYGYVGPAHIREIASSDTILEQVLHGTLRVALRGGGPPPPPPGGGGGGAGTLSAGQRIDPDNEISSPDQNFTLRYQSDGNLVLYQNGGPAIWSTCTAGHSAGYVEMQGDGNLVIYDRWTVPVWASGTSGFPGASLRVQDDGYIVVVDAGGTPVWWSGGQ